MSEHKWESTGITVADRCSLCGAWSDEHRNNDPCPGRPPDAPEPLREAIENAGLRVPFFLSFSRTEGGWFANLIEGAPDEAPSQADKCVFYSPLFPDPESAIRAALDEFKKRKEGR